MARALGIDYGKSRIGLALSDPLKITARGFLTLAKQQVAIKTVLAQVIEVVQTEDVDEIVIGLPKRTDGKISESEVLARQFGEALEAELAIPIHYFDERFTTVIAHQILNQGSKKHRGAGKRAVIDQVAAEIILQNYLDSKHV